MTRVGDSRLGRGEPIEIVDIEVPFPDFLAEDADLERRGELIEHIIAQDQRLQGRVRLEGENPGRTDPLDAHDTHTREMKPIPVPSSMTTSSGRRCRRRGLSSPRS